MDRSPQQSKTPGSSGVFFVEPLKRFAARRGVWFGVALLASGLIAASALALSWLSADWPLDSATGYAVSTPPAGSTQVEFVSTGAPLKTVARLKLNIMPTYTENTDASFTGTRSGILWSTDHFEFPSTTIPVERDANAPSLKALWRFNEASGSTTFLDTTNNTSNVNADNGATVGAAQSRITGYLSDAYGNPGKAAVFNNTGYVQVGEDYAELIPSSFSVEAWVQFTSLVPNQIIVLKSTPQFSFPPWQLITNGFNSVEFSVNGIGRRVIATNPATMATGQWYYIVGTYNGSIARLYVNGALVGTSVSGGGTPTYYTQGAGAPLYIGGGSAIGLAQMQGYLDEVAFYSGMLSDPTIAANYAAVTQQYNSQLGSYTSSAIDAGPVVKQWKTLAWTEGPLTGLGEALSGSLSGLVALWHLDEGTGSVAGDVAGITNNAALGGGAASPTWTTGRLGNALFFDGVNDTAIAVGTAGNPNPLATVTDNWTLEAWVYNLASTSPGGGADLVYVGTAPNGFGLWQGTGTGTNVITVKYGTTFFNTGVPYDVNTWNHIMVTRNAGVLLVYKNGIQAGVSDLDGATSPTAPVATDPVTIGGIGTNVFSGMLDEVAVYNRALTAAEALAHFQQGALNLRVQARSGPNNNPAGGVGWSTWRPAEGQVTSNLTYGLAGMWHFDEASGTALTDTTGGPSNTTADTGSLGTAPATPTRVTNGKFGPASPAFSALSFDGVDDLATIPTSAALTPATPSVEAWVYYPSAPSFTARYIVYKKSSGSNVGYGLYASSGVFGFNVSDGTTTAAVSSTGISIVTNQWYHLVGTYDGSAVRLYVNGLLFSTPATLTLTYDPASPIYLGGISGVPSVSFKGLIDEVAIYNRPLDADTVLSHYVGAPFTTSPATLSGGVIDDNEFLQYRTLFTSATTAQTPKLYAVSLNAQNYPKSSDGPPTVTNGTLKPAYTLLNTFTETRGPAAGQGQVRYQFSPDGSAWYWYDAMQSKWAAASSLTVNSNLASELTQAVFSKFPLPAAQGGIGSGGTLTWKAVLVSDGLQPVELDHLNAQYAQSSLTVTVPTAANTWLVSDTNTPRSYTITWNKAGTTDPLPTVKLFYAADGATYQEIDPGVAKANGANTGCSAAASGGCYVWTIPAGTATSPAPNNNPGQGISKIKVTGADPDTQSIEGISSNFTVALLNLTKPDTTDTWRTGQTQTVIWNTSTTTTGLGAVANVLLEYAKDGATYATIATAPNTGTYDWTPADTDVSPNSNPGQGVSKVRISIPGQPALVNTSQAFTVTRLNIVRPSSIDNTDPWRTGQMQTIIWNTSTTTAGLGAVANVLLEYAKDGAAYTTIATTPNTGTYDWTPADTDVSPNSNPGQGVSKVRISIPGQPALANTSQTFTITRLNVTGPTTGDTLMTGKAQTITWNTSTTVAGVPSVLLEYAKDGAAFASIATVPNSGSYALWTPADTDVSPNSNPGQGVSKVRISVPGKATLVNTSQAFTVTRLNITQPTSAATWLTSKPHAITWDTSTTVAGVPNLLLEYAKDGAAYAPIATVANTGTYDWTPADTDVSPNSNPGQGVSKVRISIPGQPALANTSQAFTVSRLTVADPAAGALWRLGKQHTINWSVSATGVTSINIEYTPDGSNPNPNLIVWKPVASNIPNTGSYLWNLPVDLTYLSNPVNSTNSLVRVTPLDAGFSVLTNVSAGFTVTRPFVRITAPAAGDVLGVNTVKNIIWEQEGLIGTNLKIEYSTNAFANESQTVVIINGSSGGTNPITSPYPWVVPQAAVSPTVKLRISDLALPEGFGVSEQFKVAGSLIVVTPAAGQVWAIGTPHTIQWTSQGVISAVKLFLSKNGAAGPFAEVDPGTAKPNGPGGGSYIWTPQAADATVNAVMQLQDAADSDVKTNSGAFQVTSLSITSPAGGERWLAGSAQTIAWNPPVGVASIKASYSLNNGNNWTVINTVPAAGGSMPWTVPSQVANGTVKVLLEDANATSQESRAQVVSNAFTIYGQLSITAPAAGASWSSGQPHAVTWTTPVGTIPSVRLEYSRDNFVNEVILITTTPNDGSEPWIPVFTSTTVKVRVVDAQDALTLSTSSFFEVTGIAIQKPDGTEVWPVGSTNKALTWTFTGSFTAVKLEYSVDDFATATLIQDNVLNTGSYTWALVPDAVSSNAKVRITPTTDPTLFSISNPFKIQGVLRLTAPNGNEVYDVASSKMIRWDATGTLPTVKLQLSTNAGAAWSDIASLTGALGGGTGPVANTYAWTVPDAVSSQARVRVVDNNPAHPASSDASDGNFSIRSVLTLLSPAASDVWGVNENHPLTWKTLGTVGTVNFEYSTDSGTTWVPFAATANCASADGVTPCTYTWTVLNLVPSPQSTPSINVRLRVRDSTPTPFRPLAQTDSPDFLVKWYKITWHILDSGSNNHLGGLNVSDVSSVPNWNGWTVADFSLTSTQAGTLFHYYPGGTFDTAWSRTGYFSGSASGWASDADKTITVYLDSETADQVEFHVHAESAYDAATDTLSFKTWLEKRGLLVGTSVADLGRLGGSVIEVYDGTTLLTTLADPSPDSKGQYEFTWPATGLVGGKVYFATASVIFPNQPAPGVTRTSGGVVNISIPKQIDTLGTATGANAVTLTQLQTELQPINTAVTTTIPNTITASQAAVQNTVTSTVGAAQTAIQTDITTSQTAVQGTVTAAQGAIQTDIAASQGAVQNTVTSTVGAAQTAIQTDVAAVQNTANNVQADTTQIKSDTGTIKTDTAAIKTDTGAIRTDVQTILVPQVNAVKADTNAIKSDTTALTADTTVLKADTAAIKADTADMRPKVTAILSDPNAGLPKVQQMLTDQTTQMQSNFKGLRRGALLNRDGSVEQGESPLISYRSEGGAPTMDLYNAAGARLLGPVLMNLDPATGLYGSALSTTGFAPGDYKVIVTEPASAASQGSIDSVTLSVREPAVRTSQSNTDVTQALDTLNTKVTDVLGQLSSLAVKADAIQSTTDATKASTAQLTTDVKTLSDNWAKGSPDAMTKQLDAIASKLGSPAQAEDTKSLVGQVSALQQLMQGAQGGSAAVGYSQSAMNAALQAVDLIKQLQQQAGTAAAGAAPPAQLIQLQETLNKISQSVAVLPGQVASEGMGQQVTQLTEQVKALASEKGYAFDSLYEMSAGQMKDVKAVRNRVEELKALLDVQRSILENRVNEPVVKTWFESNP